MIVGGGPAGFSAASTRHARTWNRCRRGTSASEGVYCNNYPGFPEVLMRWTWSRFEKQATRLRSNKMVRMKSRSNLSTLQGLRRWRGHDVVGHHHCDGRVASVARSARRRTFE